MQPFFQKKQDNLLKETIQNGNRHDYLKSIKDTPSKDCTQYERTSSRAILNRNDTDSKECDEIAENKIDDAIIPESVDHMGVRGMAQFYRAKIKSMQNENITLQVELKSKVLPFK